MEIILNNSTNASLEPCEMYSDWGAKVEHGNIYPIPPGGNITKVGMVELMFELISNSLKDLEDWYRENNSKEHASVHATKIHEDASNQWRACWWQRPCCIREGQTTPG